MARKVGQEKWGAKSGARKWGVKRWTSKVGREKWGQGKWGEDIEESGATNVGQEKWR